MTLRFPSSIRSRLRIAASAAVVALALTCAPEASAAPGKWEQVKTERSDTRTVAKDADTEIKTARGIVTVSNTRQVQVKVYTILGQLVSRETLPPGISQIAIQPHGVYIIKIGDLTCKVAL